MANEISVKKNHVGTPCDENKTRNRTRSLLLPAFLAMSMIIVSPQLRLSMVSSRLLNDIQILDDLQNNGIANQNKFIQQNSTLQDNPLDAIRIDPQPKQQFAAQNISSGVSHTCSRPEKLYQPYCVRRKAFRLARAFPDHHYSSWVISGEPQNNSSPRGVLLVKTFKAASTTSAAVAIRVAKLPYDLPSALNISTPSKLSAGNGVDETITPLQEKRRVSLVRWHHTPGVTYQERIRHRSFLFTSVRDPAARAISRIYFSGVSQHQRPPTDLNLLIDLHWNDTQYGSTSNVGGFQLRFVSLERIEQDAWSKTRPNLVLHPEEVEQNVEKVLNGYDFVLVSERLDESLVAMALIMGIDVSGVLVAPSKVSGSGYFFRNRGRGIHDCVKLEKAPRAEELSYKVQRYLRSKEWRARNYGDYLLHKAANVSLDHTIQRIGAEKFAVELSRYRRLQSQVEEICPNETFPPCSKEGDLQLRQSRLNCYSDDIGCGHRCINAVVTDASIS